MDGVCRAAPANVLLSFLGALLDAVNELLGCALSVQFVVIRAAGRLLTGAQVGEAVQSTLAALKPDSESFVAPRDGSPNMVNEAFWIDMDRVSEEEEGTESANESGRGSIILA